MKTKRTSRTKGAPVEGPDMRKEWEKELKALEATLTKAEAKAAKVEARLIKKREALERKARSGVDWIYAKADKAAEFHLAAIKREAKPTRRALEEVVKDREKMRADVRRRMAILKQRLES